MTLQDGLEALYPEDINHGRLYPSLDRMADAGLQSFEGAVHGFSRGRMAVQKQTNESDRRGKEYVLTGRGEWVPEEYLRFVREMIGPEDE